jgi:hypothetical protein
VLSGAETTTSLTAGVPDVTGTVVGDAEGAAAIGLLELSVAGLAGFGFGIVRSIKYVHPKRIAADRAKAMNNRFCSI